MRPAKKGKQRRTPDYKTSRMSSSLNRGSQIDALLESIQPELSELGAQVLTGDEIINPYTERTTTGSVGLDIITNGGLPDGCVVQYRGPRGSGKTSLAYLHAAQVQKKYGDEAAIAHIAVEQSIDKMWARKSDFVIPLNSKELEDMELTYGRKLGAAEIDYWTKSVGRITEIKGPVAEGILDGCVKLLRSGLYHLIIIDSIGVILPEHGYEESLSNQKPGSGAPLLVSAFTKQVLSAFNTTLGEDKLPNRTTLLAINQVRMAVGGNSQYQTEADPPGGKTWGHAVSIDIQFDSSSNLNDKLYTGEWKEPGWILWGKYIKMINRKGKHGCREGGVAEVQFIIDERNPYSIDPGNINRCAELRSLGLTYDVLQLGGSVIYYKDQSFRGTEKFYEAVLENPELGDAIASDILEAAGVSRKKEITNGDSEPERDVQERVEPPVEKRRAGRPKKKSPE